MGYKGRPIVSCSDDKQLTSCDVIMSIGHHGQIFGSLLWRVVWHTLEPQQSVNILVNQRREKSCSEAAQTWVDYRGSIVRSNRSCSCRQSAPAAEAPADGAPSPGAPSQLELHRLLPRSFRQPNTSLAAGSVEAVTKRSRRDHVFLWRMGYLASYLPTGFEWNGLPFMKS